MLKKMVSMTVLIAMAAGLVLSTVSCQANRIVNLQGMEAEQRVRIKVLRVYTKAGKWYTFRAGRPGVVRRNEAGELVITGNAADKKGNYEAVEIPLTQVHRSWVRRPDYGKGLFVVMAVVVVTFFRLAWAAYTGTLFLF